jgi:hypothetical protein
VLILTDREDDVIHDCRAALHGVTLHPAVEHLRALVDEALIVFTEHHWASAQCISVNVCDTLLRRVMPGHSYADMINTIRDADPPDEFFHFVLSLRPVVELLAIWRPESGNPPPGRPSRHRTVHAASPDHFTESNSLISVMLATSLLLGVSEAYAASAGRQRSLERSD